jgi:hypothetical protein
VPGPVAVPHRTAGERDVGHVQAGQGLIPQGIETNQKLDPVVPDRQMPPPPAMGERGVLILIDAVFSP